MANEELKKLERRAKALMINKEIDVNKQARIRKLLKDFSILPEQRYTSIIQLIENCPDKNISIDETENYIELPEKKSVKKNSNVIKNNQKSLVVPTETSYYIDSLIRKYNYFKLFKKKYLIKKNNRFGFGFRKRMIPAKSLLKLFKEVSNAQEILLPRLSIVAMNILKDNEIDDPTTFNFLRLIRNWLSETPLNRGFDSVKWMERKNFEREFKGFTTKFFAFSKLSNEIREKILLDVENKLRHLPELKKEEVTEDDAETIRKSKEKSNYTKEKQIYNFMMLLRSFLPTDLEDGGLLMKGLKKKYNINSLWEILFISQEVLVFQRPIVLQDLLDYYNIQEPVVSSSTWNYSESFLKEIGKDPETKRKKELEKLKIKLKSYENQFLFLKYEELGKNVLTEGFEEQCQVIDKKTANARDVYNENFFNFLDGVINFFKNAFVPFVDGSVIKFSSIENEEIQGAIFSIKYFNEELSTLNSIIDEMHFFKSNNPTLAITRDEVKKIITGQITTMSNVLSFMHSIGNLFYSLGKELQAVYESHLLWLEENRSKNLKSFFPLSSKQLEEGNELRGTPIPFYNYKLVGVENETALSKSFFNKPVLSENLEEGFIVHLISYCYQTAYEAMNEHLLNDIHLRNQLLKKIKLYSQ